MPRARDFGPLLIDFPSKRGVLFAVPSSFEADRELLSVDFPVHHDVSLTGDRQESAVLFERAVIGVEVATEVWLPAKRPCTRQVGGCEQAGSEQDYGYT